MDEFIEVNLEIQNDIEGAIPKTCRNIFIQLRQHSYVQQVFP
uniref:Uncharacterized protein n=1 Tax=Arundo donax TaxID=35708 RepID=A0A0A8XYE0_ARUDO